MKKRQKWYKVYAPTWARTKELVVDQFFEQKSAFDVLFTEKAYTLPEIKDAFWSTFHEKGYVLFEWADNPEKNIILTTVHWKRFVGNLPQKGD